MIKDLSGFGYTGSIAANLGRHVCLGTGNKRQQ
jgi:hypothetical protein